MRDNGPCWGMIPWRSLMALPLLVLYEISVWIAWYWERQERKQAVAATSD